MLVVEADAAVRARVVEALRRSLSPDGVPGAIRVEAAASASEALERLRHAGGAVVVCGDLGPGGDARALREAARREPILEVHP